MNDISDYVSEDATFTAPVNDILMQFGRATHALLYYNLFFPEFVDVHGSVILRDNIDSAEERFPAAKKASQNELICLGGVVQFVRSRLRLQVRRCY
jgi:hypothetical protein